MTTFTREMEETLRLMYAAGCTFKEIAEDLEVNELWARSKASRMGLTNRRAKSAGDRVRNLKINESVTGLTRSQVDKWTKRLRVEAGITVKRFMQNGAFGLRRIA